MAVVARKQNNPYLNRMEEQDAHAVQNSVIYKQARFRDILRVLKKNGNIACWPIRPYSREVH
jgi:lauroyl/myristoyl acyltransferase